MTMVGELRKREIGSRSLHENLDTTTPGGRLVFHVFAALADFSRELIVAGTNQGLAADPPSSTPNFSRPPATCCPTPDAAAATRRPDHRCSRTQRPGGSLVITWLGPADFPEHRHDTLLRRLAWEASTDDPAALAALVAARAAQPC
ncbi:recombinase family protein [Nonomuraea purpurea]|uniref:Recombinase family protein n=1 Tax=Nonomuraea purpurea TaxID=1849276 RepID=A0ABV8GTJ0_9ACTN